MFQQVREVDVHNTHTRTHTRSPESLFQTGKRLSAYPGVEPGRKVEKCAPQWRCSQSCSCPKPAAISLVSDERAKGQIFFRFNFNSLVMCISKVKNLSPLRRLRAITVHGARTNEGENVSLLNKVPLCDSSMMTVCSRSQRAFKE